MSIKPSYEAPLLPPIVRRVPMAPSPNNHKFSFSAAPTCIDARRTHFRADYSHNRNEVWKMNRGNDVLCKRLLAISSAPPSNEFRQAPVRMPKPGALSSHAMMRRRHEQAILAGNLQLYKRLQAVKPSGDVSRAKLLKDFEKSQAGPNAHAIVLI